MAESDQERQQARVFAFLGDPASHGGAELRRIDTHAASVFLAGERVYKVKRAVRFPFLDYSALDKRKAACDAELEVNRAFAPELYRRTVAITEQADGSLAIDGEGEAVEWAVEMQRLDEDATLDRLADAGEIDTAFADSLGRAVARVHAAAKPAGETTCRGWPAHVENLIAQNDEELAGHAALFPPSDTEALTAASRAALEPLGPLLAHRASAGLVRRCHGDLHLGNIVRIDGEPVLFDAIEFSPEMATIDVFYDLAFLLMDLWERGLTAAANAVLNRYLGESGDDEGIDALAALPLFMSLRAAIRAKVTAARLADAADVDRALLEEKARAYFAAALAFIRPPPARLVAVGGLSGTGKSVLARALAPEIGPAPGAVVLRSDVERKKLRGVAETARLGEDGYAPEVTRAVYAALASKAARALAAGHAAIVDAVYAREEERAAIRAAAREADGRFSGIFLTLAIAARTARLDARMNDASDATAATARLQEDYDLGTIDWHVVDASGDPPETLRRALHALEGEKAP